jgi:signal peptidase II
MKRFFWLSLIVLILDQIIKSWVQMVLIPYERVPVLPFFNLTLVFNKGAAFSFLSDAGGWQRGFLIALTSGVAVVLAVWLMRTSPRERLLAFGLALIIGGALGNLIDRIFLGQVVDFLDFHWAGWHWPAFNVADSAISVGVAALLWDSLINGRRNSEEGAGGV